MLRSLRLLAIATVLSFPIAALAQNAIQDLTDWPPPEVTKVGVKQHSAGEARWTDFIAQSTNSICSTAGDMRLQYLGPEAGSKPRADSADCFDISIRVENTSVRPIHCFVKAALPKADERKQRELTGDAVIFPGQTETVATTLGPKASSPRQFAMDCRIYPATYEPLVIAPGCKLTLKSVANPDEFFPAGSKRREESGDVVLDFLVDSKTQRMVDIRIAASAGYQDLDNAAIKVGKASRADSNCPAQRYRIKVKFKIKEDDDPPPDLGPGPLQPEPPKPRPNY
jgi:TonB family protein